MHNYIFDLSSFVRPTHFPIWNLSLHCCSIPIIHEFFDSDFSTTIQISPVELLSHTNSNYFSVGFLQFVLVYEELNWPYVLFCFVFKIPMILIVSISLLQSPTLDLSQIQTPNFKSISPEFERVGNDDEVIVGERIQGLGIWIYIQFEKKNGELCRCEFDCRRVERHEGKDANSLKRWENFTLEKLIKKILIIRGAHKRSHSVPQHIKQKIMDSFGNLPFEKVLCAS